jgi:hypothetical protein
LGYDLKLFPFGPRVILGLSGFDLDTLGHLTQLFENPIILNVFFHILLLIHRPHGRVKLLFIGGLPASRALGSHECIADPGELALQVFDPQPQFLDFLFGLVKLPLGF